MQKRRYVVYDVFTAEALAGNPLAVVLDADGLDTAAMQAIAREFNLSESTFVTTAEEARHSARVRIFTPNHEMPFAGHPTVGTAIALAELSGAAGTSILVLEENIGPVRCAVTSGEGISFAEFDLAVLPTQISLDIEPAVIGAALGLDAHEIGFENHRPNLWSAGVPYITVPVADLAAAAKANLQNLPWLELAGRDGNGNAICAYVYCRDTVGHGNAFHARMFVPGTPQWEDPATGSAAAAFSGAVVHFDQPMDGPHEIWIEQGLEMGRPSRIRLSIEVKGGAIQAARIGGQAVKVVEGTLLV